MILTTALWPQIIEYNIPAYNANSVTTFQLLKLKIPLYWGILRHKIMDDILMYTHNNDKQN